MIEIDKNDLLWLAGVLDGDGCFGIFQNTKKAGSLQCSVTLKMIDKDIIERVASIFCSTVIIVKSKISNHKNTYIARVTGMKSLSLMILIKPYLSLRRQQKIDDIINVFKNKKSIKNFFCCNEVPSSHSESLHWLSGLLEAEGSFSKGPPSAPNRPVISIQMTDRDVMENVALFFRQSLSSFQPKGKTKDGSRNFKLVYICQVRGSFSADLMSSIKPLMGSRRQKQIEKAISGYNPKLVKEAGAKRRIITDDQLREVYEKRCEGQTLRHIGLQYNVNKNVIARALCRFKQFCHSEKKLEQN